MTTSARIDHLVLMAATLAEGVAWCEATLGITPGPGGGHPLMGTHNRLFRIATPEFPRAYAEIIAIDPAATPMRTAGLRRWFDMDDAALRAQVAREGPQLVHWVASVPDVAKAHATWLALGIDRGPALTASRATAQGLLEWRITVRDDGQRLLGGVLPTLIQWGEVHPADRMAESGVTLRALRLSQPQLEPLQAALAALDVNGLDPTFRQAQIAAGPARLSAELATPLGVITLHSSTATAPPPP